ncbi:MAG: UDP-N-acetylmuramoyl-L-alanine--D-glutamate ligase [Legionella sp.]|nr:UDP-N-acetylmuramoyl-L-alanine--D-glutamate ligase [Legionella sp.]
MTQLVLVLGLGQTGLSIARYLKRKGLAFVMCDTREAPPSLNLFRAEFPDIKCFLGDKSAVDFAQITRVICSPGVALDSGIIQAAQAHDLLIESDIDCFAREISVPVVAITGTNGKSTVTVLLGEMAKAAGYTVGVAGNIGTPVLDCLLEQAKIDIWVLELSSFQLEITHALKPAAAAFLNLSDDHLDRHYDMTAYCAAKQRVYRGASNILFNRDDKWTYPNKAELQSDVCVVSYGKNTPDTSEWGLVLDENQSHWLAYGKQLILPIQALKIQGMHNAQNALAALALADMINLPMDAAVRALKAFKGLPHRCQAVRVLDGVRWINDSKGTNVGSTESAILGLGPLITGQLILIAGGQGKGADFSALRTAVKAHVRVLILIGEDAELLNQALGDGVKVVYAQSMHEAVLFAKQYAASGDAVCLSPACASFDWFDDFNHRGDVFTQLVEAL